MMSRLVVVICKAESKKLNCGCCEEVTLSCGLLEGHNGKHTFEVTDDGNVRYRVIWEKV